MSSADLPKSESSSALMGGATKSQAGSMDRSAAFAIGGYAICSSLMLICNKVAVHLLPAPSLVLFAQLSSAAFSVWLCGQLGFIVVDALETKKVIGFLPVAFAFLGVIFANIKTLQVTADSLTKLGTFPVSFIFIPFSTHLMFSSRTSKPSSCSGRRLL